jgi:predicted SAM-dependent methyltransferase
MKAAQVVRPGGVLTLRMPDLASSTWKLLDAAKVNPYWTDLEHCHHFSRDRIIALLNECEFEVVDFVVPGQGEAQMELYAIRR